MQISEPAKPAAPRGPGATLADAGEFGLISSLLERVGSSDVVLVAPGDDAAVVAAPDGRIVMTTDMLVEGRHFRLDWSSAWQVGRRAAAASIADVCAMGARCTSMVVSFAAPPDLSLTWALELMDGLVGEAEKVGAVIVGGDVSRSDAVIIGVTAIGDLEGRAPVLRSGARPGDVVAIAGRLGWAAAGLALLSRGFRAPRILVDAHRVPDPPYSAGPSAAVAGATAMIDVSDGLVADARHVARASGCVISIDTTRLDIPEPIANAAAAYNADPLAWVLTGGDDHALLATFPADAALPDGFVVIGSVGDGEGDVLVDGMPYADGGHEHFR